MKVEALVLVNHDEVKSVHLEEAKKDDRPDVARIEGPSELGINDPGEWTMRCDRDKVWNESPTEVMRNVQNEVMRNVQNVVKRDDSDAMIGLEIFGA